MFVGVGSEEIMMVYDKIVSVESCKAFFKEGVLVRLQKINFSQNTNDFSYEFIGWAFH
jgi:hypothetical protein